MYPVRYEADFTTEQGRAVTFFRWLLVIPWLILGSIYGFAAQIVAVIAWFAILFTGRYPEGLYEFNAGILRFTARMSAFAWLQTDRWPPFGIEEAPDYPVRLHVDSPLPAYSRAKAFFRLIIGIPVMFMLSLIISLYYVAAAVAWFHIVFTGRTSGGIHNALSTGLAYQSRASAYFLLMTETFPPVSDQEPAASLGPGDQPATLTAGSQPPPPAPVAPAKAPVKKPARKKAAAKKASPRRES